jgi:hypothetical protein
MPPTPARSSRPTENARTESPVRRHEQMLAHGRRRWPAAPSAQRGGQGTYDVAREIPTAHLRRRPARDRTKQPRDAERPVRLVR